MKAEKLDDSNKPIKKKKNWKKIALHIILGLIVLVSAYQLILGEDSETFFSSKESIEPDAMSVSLPSSLPYSFDDGTLLYSANDDGTITISKDGEEQTRVGFAVVGKINGTRQYRINHDFVWTWEKANYTRVLEWDFNDTTNETIYKNITIHTFTGYNNFAPFNWTQVWEYSKDLTSIKLKHFLTNNIGQDIENATFWYLHKMNENQELRFNDVVYRYNITNNIHLSGNFNDLLSRVDFKDYNFNYNDLIENNFDVTDIYIGDGSIVDKPNLNIMGIGFSKGSGTLQNGMTVEIDPEITSYMFPTETSIHHSDWNNGANLKADDGNDATANALNLFESTSFYNFDLGVSMVVINGIEVALAANKAGSPLCVRVGLGVQLSPDNSTTYSALKTNTYTTGISTEKIFGSLNDTWGINWEKTNLSNSNFIARIKSQSASGFGCIAEADYIKIRVNFTINTGFPPEIDLNFPINNSVNNGSSAELSVNLTDAEANVMEVIIWGSHNLSILDQTYLFHNTTIENGTLNYNWTSPIIIPDESVWGLWHLDNRSEFNEDDDDVFDFSGRSINCTERVGNTPEANPFNGYFGGGFEFETDNILKCNGALGDAFANVSINGMTVSAWVFHKGTGNGIIVARDGGGANDRFFQLAVGGASTNRSFFQIREDGNGTSCTAQEPNDGNQFTRNTWHLMTGVWDDINNETRFYLDGELRKTTECSFDEINQTAWQINEDTLIGGSGTGTEWNGTIDEVAIWNRTLSDCEVEKLYKLNPGETYYWEVNASDGNTSAFNGTWQFRRNSCEYLCGNYEVDFFDNCSLANQEITLCEGCNLSVTEITGTGIFLMDNTTIRNIHQRLIGGGIQFIRKNGARLLFGH